MIEIFHTLCFHIESLKSSLNFTFIAYLNLDWLHFHGWTATCGHHKEQCGSN